MPGFQQVTALLRRGLPALTSSSCSTLARFQIGHVVSPSAGPGRRTKSSWTDLFVSSYGKVRPPVYTGIRPPDNTKYQGNWCKSPDQYDEYAKFLDAPIPEGLLPYLPAVEAFIVDTWIPSFPQGARMRRLQRDIAFRMLPLNKRPPGKVAYEDLATVLGHLEKRGILKTVAGRSGRILILHIDAPTKYGKSQQDNEPEDQGRQQDLQLQKKKHPLLRK